MTGKEMSAVQAQPPAASPAELRLAAISLERRLALKVRAFEERYELPSAELQQALRTGAIRETAEVAEWVVAHQTLLGLAEELQARSE